MTFGGHHPTGIYKKLGPEAKLPAIPPELEASLAKQGCLRACGPEVNDWADTLVSQKNITIGCPTPGCNKTARIGREVVSCSGECLNSAREHTAYLRNHP